MKLYFYSVLMRTADAACALLHWLQARAQRLREWAWIRATKENLCSCNTRVTKL